MLPNPRLEHALCLRPHQAETTERTSLRADLLALQETKFATADDAAAFEALFPGSRSLHALGTHRSAGVTLTVLNADIQILEYAVDPAGLWVRANLQVKNAVWSVLVAYAPPGAARLPALCSLEEVMQMLPVHAPIMLGDLNTIFEPIDRMSAAGRMGANDAGTRVCRALTRKFKLADAFRTLHPDDPVFSYMQGASMSRIDHALIAECLLAQLRRCTYVEVGRADHSPMVLDFAVGPAPAGAPRTKSIPGHLFYVQSVIDEIRAAIEPLAAAALINASSAWWPTFKKAAHRVLLPILQATQDNRAAALNEACQQLARLRARLQHTRDAGDVDEYLQARQGVAAAQDAFFSEEYWRETHSWLCQCEMPSPELTQRLQGQRSKTVAITALTDAA